MNTYISGSKTISCDSIGATIVARPLGYLEVVAIMETFVIQRHTERLNRNIQHLETDEGRVKYLDKNPEPQGELLYSAALKALNTTDGTFYVTQKGIEMCNQGLNGRDVIDSLTIEEIEELGGVYFGNLQKASEKLLDEAEKKAKAKAAAAAAKAKKTKPTRTETTSST